jgi:hypothetical protein
MMFGNLARRIFGRYKNGESEDRPVDDLECARRRFEQSRCGLAQTMAAVIEQVGEGKRDRRIGTQSHH